MKMTNRPAWGTNTGLLLIRLGVGIAFLAHGISKLSHMEGTIGFFAGLGMGAFWAWVVALVETLAGLALILGIGTTAAALLLAVVMIVAVLTVKLGKPFLGGYELDFILLLSNLGLAAAGPGAYSLSGLLLKKEPPAA
jgi:uncharacterized membrane protein YphA (DoxX/SURF4 family)